MLGPSDEAEEKLINGVPLTFEGRLDNVDSRNEFRSSFFNPPDID